MKENIYKDDEQIKKNIEEFKSGNIKSELDFGDNNKKDVSINNRGDKTKEVSVDDKNIYCANCGSKIKKDDKFCTKCGKDVIKNEKEKYGVVPLIMCIISLLVIPFVSFVSLYFWGSLEMFGGASYPDNFGYCIVFGLIGLISMIVVRINYPKYILGKVVMGIYLYFIIGSLLFLLGMQELCNMCSKLD